MSQDPLKSALGDSIERPSVRLVMTILSGWILSLILTEFFKGAYRVFDVAHAKKHAWAATVVLGSCALFMSKQVADLVLYYKSSNLYDPPFRRTDTLGTLWRYAAENGVEVLILFFSYGSVHQICVQNLTESTTKTSGFLPCAVGSGLLASIAIVEFLWFIFDWLYIYKRRRNIKDFAMSKVEDQAFQSRWYPDSLIIEWIQLNGIFCIGFFIWCLSYNSRHKFTDDLYGPTAAVWLLLPTLFHFTACQYLMNDYYLGSDHPPERQSIPLKLRNYLNDWIVGSWIKRCMRVERLAGGISTQRASSSTI